MDMFWGAMLLATYSASPYGDFNFPVRSGTAAQTAPSIASNTDGTKYLVAWKEYTSSTGYYDIYGQVISFTKKCQVGSSKIDVEDVNDCVRRNEAYYGKTWDKITQLQASFYFVDIVKGTAVRINSTSNTIEKSSPAVSFDGTNYLVAWQQGPATNRDIIARFVSQAGALGTSVTIASGTLDQTSPAISFDGTNYLVAWQEGPSTNRDVIAKLVSKSGTLGASATVASGTPDQSGPAISFDGTNYLVAWQEGPSTNRDVIARLVSKSGTLGASATIASGSQDQADPTTGFDGTNYLVAWTENNLNLKGSFTGKNLSIIKTVGISDRTAANSLSKPRLAFSNYYDSTTASYYPHYIVAWTDGRALYNAAPFEGKDPDGATDGTDIYIQRIPPSGNFSDDINIPITNDFSKNGNFNRPAAGANKYMAIWDADKDNDGSREIYGRFIDKSTGQFTGSNFLIAVTNILNDNYWSYAPVFAGTKGHSNIGISYSSGKFLVVYERCSTASCTPGVSTYSQLAARTIDEQTGAVSAEKILLNPNFYYGCVNSPTAYGIPINVTGGNDEFLISWARDISGQAVTYGLFTDINGNKVGNEFAISGNGACTRVYSTAYDNINDRFLVSWLGNGLFGRLVELDGQIVTLGSSTLSIISPGIGGAYGVVYGNNGYLVVYKRQGVGYIEFFDASGVSTGSPIFIHSDVTPVAAFDGENFIIHWENMSGNTWNEAWALLVTPSGIPIGIPVYDPWGYGTTFGYKTFIASNKWGFGPDNICFPNIASNGSRNTLLTHPSTENFGKEVFGFTFAYNDTNDIAFALDTDSDGISPNTDGLGAPAENPCKGGNKTNCDDNCIGISNPNQEDIDGDGRGDACDPCKYDPSRSCASDSDNDGMSDLFEDTYGGTSGLNPNDDIDGDGLTNLQEYLKGTNPSIKDSDGDGAMDGIDIYPLDISKVWTDNTITQYSTVIKAIHITELRGAVNSLRKRKGFQPYTWADADPILLNNPVKAVHINELRTAIDQAIGAQTWTDKPIQPGITIIKAAHLQQLRSVVISAP
ncbi:MAG: hypothetical protein HY758_03970 [Nitrospirae bacterium]|nr:hypothetical protein [Nitrospirota bacterium]